MLFLYTFLIGYKIIYLTLSLITTGGLDDIFINFTSQEHLEAFRNFLNSPHANMSFTIENKKQNRMSLPDVQIICEDKTFTTAVYRKPTSSTGVSVSFAKVFYRSFFLTSFLGNTTGPLFLAIHLIFSFINPLCANPTKWSYTLKQFECV